MFRLSRYGTDQPGFNGSEAINIGECSFVHIRAAAGHRCLQL